MSINIWFTGCTHFGHERIIELSNRPFDSLEEMDEALIENHNKIVKPQDIVFHLGDIAEYGEEEEYFRRCHGHFEIILGNHDNYYTIMRLARSRTNIQSVTDYSLQKFRQTWFALFHYPIEDWDQRYKGSIHLHSHTHEKKFKRPNIPVDSALDTTIKPIRFPPDLHCNRFHVGVDATDYSPVSLDTILEASKQLT